MHTTVQCKYGGVLDIMSTFTSSLQLNYSCCRIYQYNEEDFPFHYVIYKAFNQQGNT